MVKKKNIGIELLRIVAMMMVLLLHELGQGGLLDNTHQFSMNFELSWALESLALVAVNCYALVTGYLMVTSKFKIKRVIGLWLQVIFYSWIILIVSLLVGCKISTYQIIANMLPTIFKGYWYFNAYLGMYFFIPIINKGARCISQTWYRNIVISILILNSVIPTIVPNSIDTFTINRGYSPTWLLIMYLVGGYIKLYNPLGYVPQYKKFCSYLFFSVCTFMITNVSGVVKMLITGQQGVTHHFMAYNSIFILLASISLFLFFINLKIKKVNFQKIIIFFGPLSFSAYLLQANPIIYNLLKNKFLEFKNYNSIILFLILMGIVVITFLVSSVMELSRHWIFKKIKVSIVVDKFLEKVKLKEII